MNGVVHGTFLRWDALFRVCVINACLIMAVCLTPVWVAAQQAVFLRGTVMRVIDGDTLMVRLESGPIRVRLHAMDAPEMNQPGGPEAKQALIALVQGRTVELQPVEQDRYERLIAVVHMEVLEINREMIRQGHAWAYRRYMSRSAPDYCTDEARARNAGLGLWKSPQREASSASAAAPAYIAPWEWRRRKRLAALSDYRHESVANCVAAIGRH
ncbi:thermonuclease family protein [Steroidobacter denitrificans]|nr:thermonuclease family protein [Steroidobacter denitrificans]